MTAKKGLIYAAILLGLGLLLWLLRRHDVAQDKNIASTVLSPGQREKIILDPGRHTVTTVTRTGPVKRTFLPPHPVSVTVGEDGKITVTTRPWGTELSPFIGFAYSDKARVALGVDLFYVHRWEIGPFIGLSLSGAVSPRLGIKVSYNLWSNTSLFIGVDNTKTPTGGISFKF